MKTYDKATILDRGQGHPYLQARDWRIEESAAGYLMQPLTARLRAKHRGPDSVLRLKLVR